jgi:hypothetical protein
MKRVDYIDILYQAAEAAGRTRTNLPVQEATMLQGFISTALRGIWNGNYQWPELIPAIVSKATTAGVFSKGEDATGELGDILGVWTNNPQVTDRYVALRFDEQDGRVQLEDGGGTVWVEYMLPCPNLMTAVTWDLTQAFAAGDLVYYAGTLADPVTDTPGNFYTANQTTVAGDSPDTAAAKFTLLKLPARFRNFLAWMASGLLVQADGEHGDGLISQAEDDINVEIRRLVDVPRRAVRNKNTYNAKQIQQVAAAGS